MEIASKTTDDLEALIKISSRLYYNGEGSVPKRQLEVLIPVRDRFLAKLNLGKRKAVFPFMTDAEFDAVQDELRRLDPKNPILKAIGAPMPKKVKVRLPWNMPSLNKLKPNTGSIPTWLNSHPGPYVLSDKLDGVSLLLRNETGRVEAYTRGDGMFGGDISFMVPHFKMPKLPKGYTVRAEVLMHPGTFEKKWATEFVNPRNMVAGITNRNDIHKAVQDIHVVIFEVLEPRGIPSAQLAKMKSLGFQVVPFKKFDELDEGLLSEMLEKRRSASKFEIDGLVITQDKKNPIATGNPDWMVAFKSEAQNEQAKAKVVKIEWQVARTGFIIPVLEIEPVKLAGATIRRVTAHNAKFVYDNRLGPGAVVTIIRSGQVIPKVVGVVTKAARVQEPPKSIGEVEWEGVHLKLHAGNTSGSRQEVQLKSIVFFFTTIGVERFKAATIQKFINAGIDTAPKILKLPRSQFINMEGGSKVLIQVYDQIQDRISDLPLSTLMAASQVFGRSFGTRRASAILKAYPNILDYAYEQPQRIIGLIEGIPGFDTLTASKFAAYLQAFVKWLQLVPMIHYTLPGKTKTTSNRLAGQRVILTGFRDSDLSKLIIENGGGEASTVKNATVLLVKDKASSSSKATQARQLGIPIMTADEFRRKYQL